mmetsp:Transcript_6391/g.10751  ORF Transcript_6391/g.10751 Transcript_6391/m.10751 type:complete len:319 (+) Transcript_6391:88-1044(+)
MVQSQPQEYWGSRCIKGYLLDKLLKYVHFSYTFFATSFRVEPQRIRLLEEDDEGIPSTTLRTISALRFPKHRKHLREISILRRLKHPNIVEFKDTVISEGRLYLVFEFVNMDLYTYIHALDGRLSPQTMRSCLTQLLRGVHFCHMRGVMHRNLIPRHILVSRDGRLKLAGFGLARAFELPIEPITDETMFRWYCAPEILLGCTTYTQSIDTWSIGTILAEMTTKRPLFHGDTQLDTLFTIFRMLGTPNEETWPGVTALQNWNKDFPVWPSLLVSRFVPGLSEAGVDLLEQLLALDPCRRISCEDALKHPYLADMANAM